LRDFLPRLEGALEIADVACLLIAAPIQADNDAVAEIARPLIRVAQMRDVAALVPDRATLAKNLGADGVQVDLRSLSTAEAVRAYRNARKELAGDAIVGAFCPPERHLAMEVAEAGADYVGFDLATSDAVEVIAWWGEMMTVPCVAFGRMDSTRAGALARSGADFVAPEPELWSGVDPAGDLAALQAAIRTG